MVTIAPFSNQFALKLKDEKNIIIPSYVLKNNCDYNFEGNINLENVDSDQMNNFLNFLIDQEIFLKKNNLDKLKICKDISHVADILKYNNHKIKLIKNFFKKRFEIKDNTFIEKWMIEIVDRFIKENFSTRNNYLKLKKFMELSEIELYEMNNTPIKEWDELKSFLENKKPCNLEKYQKRIFERIKFLKTMRLKCEVCDSCSSMVNRKRCIVCKSKLNPENLVKI